MSRIKGTKSSAALIVAVVALVAALGGGAVAGVTISKLNKKEKKQAKRIANRQIKQKAPSLSVRSAETANSANTANTADSANTANSASPSGPAGGELTGDYPEPSIANETVNSSKIIDGQVRAADLGAITVDQVNGTVADKSTAQLNATCPAGTRVINGGGGINLTRPPSGVSLTASLQVFNGWRIIVRNDSGAPRNIFAEVQCLEE